MVAGPPRGDVVVPTPVALVASGRDVRAVWENERGGLTFEVGRGVERVFVKWSPAGSMIHLGREAERLAWARPFTVVAKVIDQGADDAGSWLVTEALSGESAVSERWQADPAVAVTAIGQGLRHLHDALPVDECPYSWSIEDRGGSRDAPPIDRLVVCHGDPCAPNTLVGDDGTCSGHVDLGALGVADRWADLAVATWSTEWNYGPGWEELLLDAYGVAFDPLRTEYYRDLWEFGT